MQIKLDENNRIVMYGGEIFEFTCDIELPEDDLKILNTYFNTYECYLKDNRVELGNPISFILTDEEELTQKRESRKILLEAFDKWEKAVLRGREIDDYMVMDWYYSLLDLKDEAFISIPHRIEYYL